MRSDSLSRPAPRARRLCSRAGTQIILYGLLIVMAIPFIYPLLWMVFAAFKPASEIFATPPQILPQEWTLEGVEKIFTTHPFARQIFNSLYISVIVTIGSIVFAALAGYAFARIRFPFANQVFLVLVSAMMIPAEVTIIPIFRWVADLGLLDTHLPLIVLHMLGPQIVVPVFIFRQFFLSLPHELEEAATLDGAGRVRTFLSVAMPLAGPAVAAVGIMRFLGSFNMYLEPLIFLRTESAFTVGVGLTRYDDVYGEPLYNTQLGATAITIIPILIVFLFAQRQFVEGLANTGIKG